MDIDVIVFCTGYEFTFPFLETSPRESLNALFDANTLQRSSSLYLTEDGFESLEVPFEEDRWRCGVRVRASLGRVEPLFHHTFSATDTSLAFIGIPVRIVPFPLFEKQAQWIAAVFTDKVSLPSANEMFQWIHEDLRWRKEVGIPPHQPHFLGSMQWEYNDRLADFAGVPRLPAYLKRIYEHVGVVRRERVDAYKTMQSLQDTIRSIEAQGISNQ
jgi:hypothetical protein